MLFPKFPADMYDDNGMVRSCFCCKRLYDDKPGDERRDSFAELALTLTEEPNHEGYYQTTRH